jgi:hypothetical protein
MVTLEKATAPGNDLSHNQARHNFGSSSKTPENNLKATADKTR